MGMFHPYAFFMNNIMRTSGTVVTIAQIKLTVKIFVRMVLYDIIYTAIHTIVWDSARSWIVPWSRLQA